VPADLLLIALSASAGQLGASGQIWAGLGHTRLRLVAARIAFRDLACGEPPLRAAAHERRRSSLPIRLRRSLRPVVGRQRRRMLAQLDRVSQRRRRSRVVEPVTPSWPLRHRTQRWCCTLDPSSRFDRRHLRHRCSARPHSRARRPDVARHDRRQDGNHVGAPSSHVGERGNVAAAWPRPAGQAEALASGLPQARRADRGRATKRARKYGEQVKTLGRNAIGPAATEAARIRS